MDMASGVAQWEAPFSMPHFPASRWRLLNHPLKPEVGGEEADCGRKKMTPGDLCPEEAASWLLSLE